MKNHLLNPNQLRNRGLVVNEVPLQHLPPAERQLVCHSIVCPDPHLHIPLTLKGIMSGFETRLPTLEEIEDHEERNVTWVHFTSSEPWEPQAKIYAQVEEGLRDALVGGLIFTRRLPDLQIHSK